MSLDALFEVEYKADEFNCAHFVCLAWKELTGEPINERLKSFLLPVKDRTANIALRHDFVRLERPETPCVAVFHRRGAPPHVGIYLRGKVLHLHELGVQKMPLEIVAMGFDTVRYYK